MVKSKRQFLLIVLVITPLFSFCELNKSAEQLYKNGITEFANGKTKTAYQLFNKASKKDPLNSEYHWAAARAASNQNDAYLHIKAAWDNGLKNQFVLMQLSTVSFHTNADQRVAYTLSLFNELPDSLKTDSFKGDLFFFLNRPDSAISVWKSIEKDSPDPVLSYKIASAYEKKGSFDTLYLYLKECRKKNLLNSGSYIKLMSLYAIQYNYSAVDSLFAEALGKNIADDMMKIEHASIFISRNDFSHARELLSEMIDSKMVAPSLRLRAAVTLLYIFAGTGEKNEIKKLSDQLKSDTQIISRVQPLADFYVSKDTNITAALNKIRAIHLSIPGEPYATLPYINTLFQAGKYSEADSLYRGLPQVILASPLITTDFAHLKLKIGKDDEAMKLINRLHENKLFSKKSLELFRDISFKKNLFEKATAAQSFLEKKFKDDIQLQLKGALLALNQGKADSAITLLSDLAKKHPDEPQFEILRINAILIKGDYERVLVECDKSPLAEKSKSSVSLLKARAFRKLQRNDDAITAFNSSISEAKGNSSEVVSEFAGFLIEIGKSDKAAVLFQDILNSYDKKSGTDSSELAILLNNFAWASAMSSQTVDKTVIDAAKKAFDLQPNNVNILDTYVTILIKSGKYKECVSLLKDNNNIKKEPRMLIYLAQAYEKINEKNKAVRLYIDALAITDTIGKMPLQINRSKLSEHIAVIQSEK